MKCPHCGKEHPDDFKVCPYTAKPIETQSQYCKNEGCDFRSPLPLSAKFCPNCGKPLNSTIVVDNPVSTPFCCMAETTEEEYLTWFQKYKLLSETGESLSEFEFHIVAESRKEFNESDYIHQLLLFEAQNNHLYYLDAKGLLNKIDKYGDEDGFREGKSYWDNKWRYDAEIMDENHILYRNGTMYSLYYIGSDSIPVLRNRFSTKLHNLCRGKLIGDYICTDKASIRISDGCYETISGYKRCRCIGYDNDNPIFAASKDTDWSIDEMSDGCDIVDLTGRVLWHCQYYCIYEFNASYVKVFNEEDNQGLLYLLTGEIFIPIGDYNLSLTPFKDIIEVYKKWNSGAYSIKHDKSYLKYERFGNYYGLIEKIAGGYIAYLLNSENEVLFQFKTGYIDNDNSFLLKTISEEYSPLFYHNGEIINFEKSKGIYQLDVDDDDCIGISLLTSRFSIKNSSAIEIVDFDGNILNRIFVEDGWYSASMGSNGYVLLYNPRQKLIKYYDLDFNEHLLRLPRLPYNNPKRLYLGDMLQDNVITLHDGSQTTCVILTTSGEIIYDGCGLDFVAPGIFKGYDAVVNMEKRIVIKNCKEIIV